MSVSAPSREDPVARMTSAVAGGPAGRRLLAGVGFWQAPTVLVLFATVSMALSVVGKNHCRTAGWSTPDHFWHACYSDVPVLYGSSSLGGGARPSLGTALGEGGLGLPPLLGTLMWVFSGIVNAVAPGNGADAQAVEMRRFFDASAVLMTVVLLLAVLAVVAAVGRRRRWDAAHLALSPVLLSSALISYDLVTVLCIAAAFWAWSRSRVVAAGVFAGLAICARPVTALLLVAVLAACLRAGRVGHWARFAGVATLVWGVVRFVLFSSPLGALGDDWQSWKASGPGYGSLWLVPQLLSSSKPAAAGSWFSGGIGPLLATMITMMGLTAVAAATLVLGLTGPRRPRVAHLALFALASGLLVVKALPPQLSLLLLPLIALAGLRWRDHLIWAGAELAYFVGVWLYIAKDSDPSRGLPDGLYLVLIVARCAAIAWLAVQAVRAMRRPQLDPVRTPRRGAELADAADLEPDDGWRRPPGEDDPAGGPLDGRDDALLVAAAATGEPRPRGRRRAD